MQTPSPKQYFFLVTAIGLLVLVVVQQMFAMQPTRLETIAKIKANMAIAHQLVDEYGAQHHDCYPATFDSFKQALKTFNAEQLPRDDPAAQLPRNPIDPHDDWISLARASMRNQALKLARLEKPGRVLYCPTQFSKGYYIVGADSEGLVNGSDGPLVLVNH